MLFCYPSRMKKLPLIVTLGLVAIAGFAVGQLTGSFGTVAGGFPLLPTPPKTSVPAKIAAVAKDEKNLIVEVPLNGANLLDSSFDVAGRAKTGAGAVRIALVDSNGATIAVATTDVQAAPGDVYGRFDKTLVVPSPAPLAATVEVSLGDGSESVTRTVTFGPANTVAVKLYFPSHALDAGGACDIIFPVQRQVSATGAVYRSTLEALLKGPDATEGTDGYWSAIPSGVTLKSATADGNGVVTADFSSRMNRGISDKCRASMIRAQIGATLEQFPEVRDIVIAIDGRPEAAFQP